MLKACIIMEKTIIIFGNVEMKNKNFINMKDLFQ